MRRILNAVSMGAMLCMLSYTANADTTGFIIVQYDTSVKWAPALVNDAFTYDAGAWTETEQQELNGALKRTVEKLLKKKEFSFADAADTCVNQCKLHAKTVDQSSSNGMSCGDVCANVMNRFIGMAEENAAVMFNDNSSISVETIDGKYRLNNISLYSDALNIVKSKRFCNVNNVPAKRDGMTVHRIFEVKPDNNGKLIGVMFAYTDGNFDNAYYCMATGYESLRFKQSSDTVNGKITRKLLYTNVYESDFSALKTQYVPAVQTKINTLRELVSQTEQMQNVFDDVYSQISLGNGTIGAANTWLENAINAMNYHDSDSVVFAARDFDKIENRLDNAISGQQAIICAHNKLKSMGATESNTALSHTTSSAEAQTMAQRWINDAIKDCDAVVELKSFQCSGPSCSMSGAGRIRCTVGDIAINYDFDGLCN